MRENVQATRRVLAATALIGVLLVLAPGESAKGQEAIVRKPPDGAIVIDKLVLGDTGLVDDIAINVHCEQEPDFGDAVYDKTTVIPAGTTSVSLTFAPIATPSDCVVTEVDDGRGASVTVAVNGLPATLRLNPNEVFHLGVTNDAQAITGDLALRKVSFGPAADQRGDVVVDVDCTGPTGAPFSTTVVLPPGAVVTRTVPDIVAGSSCVVEETDDGAPVGVDVTTIGSPVTVTIPADDAVTATIANRYTLAQGFVQVTKEIDDPTSARGDVSIDIVCDGDVVSTFDVPSGDGPFESPPIGVAAGSSCSAVETADGSNTDVSAEVTIVPGSVDIVAGQTAAITVTDVYTPVPPDTISVTITKEIRGEIGAQGPVLVLVNCGGRLGAIAVPAGAALGDFTTTISDVASGATCTIVEPLDGANSAVSVDTVGTGTDLTPIDGALTVTDTYTELDGQVTLVKSVGGSAADRRGPITVEITCDDGSSTSATFDPGDEPTDVVLAGIAPGSVCELAETADGSTPSVGVTTGGLPATVVVGPGDDQVVLADNVYELLTGDLVVFKEVRGYASEFRGQIRIDVECDDGTEDSLISPPRAPVPPLQLMGLPAGTSCDVTEVEDGSTNLVNVDVEPPEPQTVVIEADTTTAARVIDTYTSVRGTLTVTKVATGPGADLRGDIRIGIACNSATAEIVMPASFVGPDTLTIDDLFPGEVCAIDEISNGAIDGVVDVDVDVDPARIVDVGPGENQTITVTNNYVLVSTTTTTPTTTTTLPGPTTTQGQITTTTDDGSDVLPPTGGSQSGLAFVALLLAAAGATLLIARRAPRG